MRSALVSAALVGLLALAAGGQPPPPSMPKAPPPKLPTMEDDIAKALRTHPDVLVAEAAAQLANAKLQQSKLAVAGKVMAAKREKDRAKLDVGLAGTRVQAAQKVADAAAKHFDETKMLQKNAVVSAAEVQLKELAFEKAKLAVVEAEQTLQGAKLALSAAEADYDTLIGASPATKATGLVMIFQDGQWKAERTEVLLDANHNTKLVLNDVKPGSVADKLRTALTKPIAHECKGESFDDIAQALKAKAGLDVMVRSRVETFRFTIAKQELTLAAWLEFLRDEYANRFVGDEAKKSDWYVREYGLSFSTNGRPEGALTVGEFVKAMTTEKKAEESPKKP